MKTRGLPTVDVGRKRSKAPESDEKGCGGKYGIEMDWSAREGEKRGMKNNSSVGSKDKNPPPATDNERRSGSWW